MERTDDIGNYWLGCIIDSPPLALFGVIFSEKGFVEVDDGIATLTFTVKPVEDAAGIGHGQHFRDIVHDPFKLFWQVP